MPRRFAMYPSIENTPSVAISLKRLGLEVGEIVVLVPVTLRLAEPDAVDDRGMVQLVGDDGVLGAEQRFEQAAVGIEAG